jgi:hypothetical protein
MKKQGLCSFLGEGVAEGGGVAGIMIFFILKFVCAVFFLYFCIALFIVVNILFVE